MAAEQELAVVLKFRDQFTQQFKSQTMPQLVKAKDTMNLMAKSLVLLGIGSISVAVGFRGMVSMLQQMNQTRAVTETIVGNLGQAATTAYHGMQPSFAGIARGFGDTSIAATEAYGIIVRESHKGSVTQKELAATLGLARVAGISVGQAATLMGDAIKGDVAPLQQVVGWFGNLSAEQDTLIKRGKDATTAMDNLKASFNTVAQKLLTDLNPALQRLSDFLSQHPEVAGLIGAIALVTGAVLAVGAAVIGAALAFGALDVAAAPWIALGAAVIAVGVALYELIVHWKAVLGFIEKFGGLIAGLFGPIGQFISMLIGLAQNWRAIWDGMKAVFETVWNAIKAVAVAVWDGLKVAWDAAWGWVKSVAEAIWDGLAATWNAVWDGIKTAISTVWGWLKTAWDDSWGWVKGVGEGIWDGLKTAWSVVWDTLKGVVSGVWGGIVSAVKSGVNDVISAINFFIRAIDAVSIHIPSIGIGPVRSPGFDWGGLNIPEIKALGQGGIVTRPTLAMIGEKGPEAVLPLGGGRGGGGLTVIFNNPVIDDEVRQAKVVADLRRVLAATARRGLNPTYGMT